MALLPGALTVYLAFNAGGYFPSEPAALATILLVVLAGRLLLAADPLAGLGRGVMLAAAALALFVVWTLSSGSWSGAHGRALVEADRPLLYVVILVLFGSLGSDARRLSWMIRGLALAAVVVCATALTTRLLPGVWPIDYESISPRLSYPITYWNTLGLLAALGMVLCFGMTSSEREPRAVRVLSCAALPLLGSALLLTLSRGSILAVILGLVVFAVVGHPRALLSGLIASVPTTAIAVAYAYHSDLLVSKEGLTRAARDQGETLAIVVALCVLGAVLLRMLLLRLDSALTTVALARRARRAVLIGGVVAVGVALTATAIAVDLPRQYDQFVHSEAVTAAGAKTDLRQRLGDSSSNGRVTQWRVAVAQFERTPLRGRGAGTNELVWNQHRPYDGILRDGHSLYLEVLAELGVVGLALILTTIITILVGVALRIRGPHRAVYATVFSAGLAWAIAAGYDWHWEMAVVTLWFFALGGMAIARAGSAGAARSPAFWLRCAGAGLCCTLALLLPLRVAVSQDRLQTSLDAFLTGQCDTAVDAAHASLRAVGSRSQPYEVLAYCALVDARPTMAVRRMDEAVRRDPDNWRLQYGLARMQAMTGRDPRQAVRAALRLNPLEKTTRDAAKRLAGLRRPAQWRRAAQGMEILLPDV